MMRVLVIEPAGKLWGSERALLDFVNKLPGFEAGVCCPPATPIIAELEKISVRTFPYFIESLHDKGRSKRLWAAICVVKACSEFRPDIIYLNQGGCYRVALPAARLFNLPIVAHVRIFEDVQYFARLHPSPSRLRALVAISRTIANDLGSYDHLSSIPQHTLYDAYVPFRSATETTMPARVLNRIASVGRVVPIKGQQLLIDAMHWLRRNTDEKIECHILGDGPKDFVRLLKISASQGAASADIQWQGTRKDIVPFLRSCAAMVCPSYREALGRVIFEAWDAGAVPVACRTSGGGSETIAAAEGGVLYAEPKADLLAEALRTAVKLPQKDVARLVANGREWMAQNCDPVRYCAAMAKILSAAISAHRNS
jgi:glycosyltransferase involved in cell wall biosynthesis